MVLGENFGGVWRETHLFCSAFIVGSGNYGGANLCLALMSQKIMPAIWCQNNAGEAAQFYAEVFQEARIVEHKPGLATTVDIHGLQFLLINGGDMFAPNPSISGLLNFDPLLFGGEEGARAYLDKVYEQLCVEELRPLDEYPFSKRYAWIRDKYGVTWQLMLTDPEGEPRPFVVPSFMFGQVNHFKAEAASDKWISLFDDSRRGTLIHYQDDAEGIDAGSVMFTDFQLCGEYFAAMDAGEYYEFTFTPGVSILVFCKDQEEIDRLWNALSAVPEAESCGWCQDEYGISWQIVPENIFSLMANEQSRDKILSMKKIQLDQL